jgi:hypothetical protein
MLSAHDVRHEDISDLVGRSSTSVTEPVYRHEIRSMLTKGRDGHEPQFEREGRPADLALPWETHWLPNWLPKLRSKNPSDQSGRRDLNPRPLDPQILAPAREPQRMPRSVSVQQSPEVRRDPP